MLPNIHQKLKYWRAALHAKSSSEIRSNTYDSESNEYLLDSANKCSMTILPIVIDLTLGCSTAVSNSVCSVKVVCDEKMWQKNNEKILQA